MKIKSFALVCLFLFGHASHADQYTMRGISVSPESHHYNRSNYNVV